MKDAARKLKIAFVSDAVYPYNIGGKEKRIYELTTRLAKKGHDVTIYTMQWWKGSRTRIENGVKLQAISPFYPLYHKERRSIKEAIMFSLHCFNLLKENFDVIDVDHMPHLVLFPIKIVTLLKRKKMFVTWNEVWGRKYWIKYLGIKGYLAYIIERLSVKLPDRIISVSDHTTDRLKVALFAKQQIETITNGIDMASLEKIKPSKIKSDIIYAGRLLTHKNIDKLLYAIKELQPQYPNLKTVIVGNGPEEKKLKSLAKSLKIEKNITFLDFMKDNNEIYSLIKSSKTFVFPSSREGFGLVAIEAQALGIPVITYNHPHNATKDLIQEGENGYLFDHSLSNIIRFTLKNLINDEKIKYSVRKYDWNILVNNAEEVYFS